jgi:uncharacterized protein
MHKINVVIIHGNGGCTNQDNWYAWLQRELEKKSVSVLAPTMPDNIQAKASVWLPYMDNVLKCDENTIIVGHSSGAVAALRYAETHKILGTVLVGVCYTDLGYQSERISGYYDAPWQWDAIKANQQWVALLASTDDPFIPISEPRFVNDKLDCEYYEFDDQGHFMNDDIPAALAVILAKLNR